MTPEARPVLLAGPTASGKSELALRLAERDGGCVINADASQVYGCWRVLTARPDDADLARAPHRLYGHVGCGYRYSAGAWLRDVTTALAEARRDGLRPIVVGGTGLYFAALTEGLVDIPAIPPELRQRSEALLRAGDLAAMVEKLARDDPATHVAIDLLNPMRVQRAWEVLMATGRGLSSWQAETERPLVAPEAAVRIVLRPDVEELNRRISARFATMLSAGALDECRAFVEAGYPDDGPAARVLGAAPLIAHTRGEMTLDAAVDAAITATRRYAKRQRTWMRNRMADWTVLAPSDAAARQIPSV